MAASSTAPKTTVKQPLPDSKQGDPAGTKHGNKGSKGK